MTPIIPEGIRIWARGSCVPVAMYCAPQLTDNLDWIVQGEVRFHRCAGWQQHTWMFLDGELFDPTFAQFRRFKGYPKVERKICDYIVPSHYYARSRDFLRDEFWQNRVQIFGILPSEITEARP